MALWRFSPSLFTNPKLNMLTWEFILYFFAAPPATADGIIIKENIPYCTDSTAVFGLLICHLIVHRLILHFPNQQQ